jgi:hypothetical protein
MVATQHRAVREDNRFAECKSIRKIKLDYSGQQALPRRPPRDDGIPPAMIKPVVGDVSGQREPRWRDEPVAGRHPGRSREDLRLQR